jgi:SAM-dependent methyltransferase
MAAPHTKDSWADGNAYDGYIGRWSRVVARDFIDWLGVPPGARWLDVGCGTGALSETILAKAAPHSVKGIDPAPAYLAMARENVRDKQAEFAEGSAQAIPENDSSFDAAVSGLVLNFVPDPATAVQEMARVTKDGGTIAVYVWDYAESMQLLRYFWDAATALDPAAAKLDEGKRFSVCNEAGLTECFTAAGLRVIENRLIRVKTPSATSMTTGRRFCSARDLPAVGSHRYQRSARLSCAYICGPRSRSSLTDRLS